MALQIEERIIEIIKNNIDDLEGKEVTQTTKLEDIGMDSIGLVETIFDLEEEFDITIPNPGEVEDFDTNFKTTHDVTEIVHKLMADKADAA